MIINFPKMKLTEKNAFIFTVYLPSIKQHKKKFWASLSDEEKEHVYKFSTAPLKDQYVLSHGFLRNLLSRYVESDPHHIEYRKNEYGKPFLVNDCKVKFNMSHSRDSAAYIIALDCDVGIDIEWMGKEINIHDISNFILSSPEVLYFNTLNLREKQKAFYTIWTKKEAILKAIGKGLSYPIRKITVIDSIQSGQFYDEINQKRFYYLSLKNFYSYALAIALSHKVDTLVHTTYEFDTITQILSDEFNR